MNASFGRMILSLPEGSEQEYELAKSEITIGRAMNNDIVLGDARVSHTHSRLECTPQCVYITDLGSSNGTRLNGSLVTRASLSPGDVINLGSTTLRYESAAPAVEADNTIIDNETDLTSTLQQAALSMTINETNTSRLVIHTPEKTWEVSLEGVDSLTIGRAPDNEVVIDHSSVSRRHARLARRGNSYVVRDLDSTNGTWLGDQRIEEHILQDSNVLRIGNAQVVFKCGFTSEELTLAGVSLTTSSEKRPVIFVPGLMGSELWRGNERIWPNVKILFKKPGVLLYPDQTGLEPRGIVQEVVIVPNLLKLEQYSRMGDYLVEDLGYTRGKDFFEYAYDWREDVRISSRKLAQFVDGLPIKPPFTIIAHSLGTLVTRYYVECIGGKHKVDRILLMGGPHQGTPKAITSLMLGPQVLPFGLLGERLKEVLATFPTAYQVLPQYACGTDQNGVSVNFFKDDSWLTEQQHPLLRNAREFWRELSPRSSVPCVSIFGYGLKTAAKLFGTRDTNGRWSKVSFVNEQNGDTTVPERSAILEGSEIHPVQQHHGALFVDNDVKMRLKLELIGRNIE